MKKKTVTKRSSAKATTRAKKKYSWKGLYTYDTPMGVIEQNLRMKLGISPDMKLGDYLKESKEGECKTLYKELKARSRKV